MRSRIISIVCLMMVSLLCYVSANAQDIAPGIGETGGNIFSLITLEGLPKSNLEDAVTVDDEELLGLLKRDRLIEALQRLYSLGSGAERAFVVEDKESGRSYGIELNEPTGPGMALWPVTITVETRTYNDDGQLILKERSVKIYGEGMELLNEGKVVRVQSYENGRLASVREVEIWDDRVTRKYNAFCAYDHEGNLVYDLSLTINFDGEGNVVTTQLNESHMKYDARGNLVRERSKYEYTYSYDGDNIYTTINETDNFYAYDENGNMIHSLLTGSWKSARNGEYQYNSSYETERRFAYDSEGRLIHETYKHETRYNNGGSGREYERTYEYDGDGNLVRMEENGSYWYFHDDPFWQRILENTFNALGKLTKKIQAYKEWLDIDRTIPIYEYANETSYKYDKDGNVSREDSSYVYRYYTDGQITYTNEWYSTKNYADGKIKNESSKSYYNGILAYDRNVVYVYDPGTGNLKKRKEVSNNYDGNGELSQQQKRDLNCEYYADGTKKQEKEELHTFGWTWEWVVIEEGDIACATYKQVWGELSSYTRTTDFDTLGRKTREETESINNYHRWYPWKYEYVTTDAKMDERFVIWPWYNPVHRTTTVTAWEYAADGTTYESSHTNYFGWGYDENGSENLIGSKKTEAVYNADGKLIYQKETGTNVPGYGWYYIDYMVYREPIFFDRVLIDEDLREVKLSPREEPYLPNFYKYGTYTLEMFITYYENGELKEVKCTYIQYGGKEGNEEIGRFDGLVLFNEDGTIADKKYTEAGVKYWSWDWYYIGIILDVNRDGLYDKTDADKIYNDEAMRLEVEDQLAEYAGNPMYEKYCADMEEREEITALSK